MTGTKKGQQGFLPPTIVASMMHQHGETGVQTHINDALQYLNECGYNPQFVGPEESLRLERILYYSSRSLSRILGRKNRVGSYLIDRILTRALRTELSRRLQGCSSWTVYAQDPLCALAALLLKTGREQRVVLGVHFNVSQADEMVSRGVTRQGDWLYRLTQRQEQDALTTVDGVVYFSSFMREQIRLRGIAPRSSIVVPHSTPISTPDRRAEPRDLIAIGTLEPRKNQAYILQVLHEAALRGYRYRLTIVGSGQERQRLENLATELGLRGQVLFVGKRLGAASLLAAHKVFVHAAKMESFGIALVEALAAGRPILAPKVGGISEIIRDGVEGFFWPLDDPCEGAQLLIRILEDEWLRQSMSHAARIRFNIGFDRNTVGRKLVSYVRPESSRAEINEPWMSQQFTEAQAAHIKQHGSDISAIVH